MPETSHGPAFPSAGHDTHRRLLARLREQADDVRRLTRDLTDAQLATRTVPDKWSIKELLCHLWRVQQLFLERIDRMLREDTPTIARYDPDSDPDFAALVAQPASAALAGFLADRERLIARLEALSPAEWHRPGRHPEFPHYDVHFQVEYLAYHEAHHLYQMFQRRAPLAKVPH